MIENLQDELYQLENKQAKGTKLHDNIRSWKANNAPKLSSKYLKDRIWKNQTIFELYTDDNKSKYSSELPQLLPLKLFAKFLT